MKKKVKSGLKKLDLYKSTPQFYFERGTLKNDDDNEVSMESKYGSWQRGTVSICLFFLVAFGAVFNIMTCLKGSNDELTSINISPGVTSEFD